MIEMINKPTHAVTGGGDLALFSWFNRSIQNSHIKSQKSTLLFPPPLRSGIKGVGKSHYCETLR